MRSAPRIHLSFIAALGIQFYFSNYGTASADVPRPLDAESHVREKISRTPDRADQSRSFLTGETAWRIIAVSTKLENCNRPFQIRSNAIS